MGPQQGIVPDQGRLPWRRPSGQGSPSPAQRIVAPGAPQQGCSAVSERPAESPQLPRAGRLLRRKTLARPDSLGVDYRHVLPQAAPYRSHRRRLPTHGADNERHSFARQVAERSPGDCVGSYGKSAVRSRRAGERIMASVSRFLTNKLRLTGQRGEKRGGATGGA